MCPKLLSRDDGSPTEGKKKVLFLLLPLVALGVSLYQQKDTEIQRKEGQILPTVGPRTGVPACVPASIHEFPGDLFSQEQRRAGWVFVHFLATAYLCLVLAIVCDQFFVPTLEIIAESLNVPVDVAGATFMAIGTSSPELYSAVIGSFVTKGDIGIGTIVGSAVFNILGVTSVTGILLWNTETSVDWFPISRDSLVYIFSVTTLICIIQDNVVTSVESVLLLMLFAVYIAVMYFNSTIKEWGEGTVEDLHRWWKESRRARASSFGSRRALTLKAGRIGALMPHAPTEPPEEDIVSDTNAESSTSSEDEDEDLDPWSVPSDRLQRALWLVSWPALLLLTLTIPSCRKPDQGNYALTFLSSVVWIGLISYMCSWMVTIISHTFGLPDSVAGITILAAGISVPEIIASFIVVKSGMANMALSNLIGSNIFDILFCLGLPWFIKTTFLSPTASLVINSSALTYTTATLLSTVLLLFVTLAACGWRLNRKVGMVCLVLYAAFLVVACMCEMNVFGDMNPPTCPD